MTWGYTPWGLGPWGGIDFGLELAAVQATSERTVIAELTIPPLQQSPVGFGDALNPESWGISVEGQDLHVVNVRKVSPTQFELYTLRKFKSVLHVHQVDASLVLDPSGLTIGVPNVQDFFGLVATLTAKSQPSQVVDISNPPFDGERPSGTLLVEATGDYRNEGGLAFFKKLIVRRLTTQFGAFFHLTDYGENLRLKEPLPTSDVVKLQAQIALSLQREPEFQSVGVRLTLYANGALLIEVAVRLATGGAVPTVQVVANPPLVTS